MLFLRWIGYVAHDKEALLDVGIHGRQRFQSMFQCFSLFSVPKHRLQDKRIHQEGSTSSIVPWSTKTKAGEKEYQGKQDSSLLAVVQFHTAFGEKHPQWLCFERCVQRLSQLKVA